MRTRFLLLILVASAAAQTQKTQPVTVEGCVAPGVEGGCLMVTGKDGKVWDISTANPRPKIGGRAIHLTGQFSGAPSYCMQGTKLDHIQWHYTDAACPGTPAPK